MAIHKTPFYPTKEKKWRQFNVFDPRNSSKTIKEIVSNFTHIQKGVTSSSVVSSVTDEVRPQIPLDNKPWSFIILIHGLFVSLYFPSLYSHKFCERDQNFLQLYKY